MYVFLQRLRWLFWKIHFSHLHTKRRSYNSSLYYVNAADVNTPTISSAEVSLTVNSALITPTVTATIPVGSGPWGVAVTPNGAFAYVTNYASGTVSVIGTATNAVTATITVGSMHYGVAHSQKTS